MRVPKYRLHKGSGRALVEHRGKTTYLPGPHGSARSRRAYAAFVASLDARTEPQEPAPAGSVSLFILAYLQHSDAYYANSPEERGHLNRLGAMISSEFGRLQLKEFGPTRFKRIRQKLVDNGGSRRYCNDQANRIKRIWKWGVENEWIRPEALVALQAVQPLRAGKSTAAEPKVIKPVAWKHVRAILPHVSPTIAAMIRIHWLTGMRSDNLCRMRAMDIDRSWVYRPKQHKGSHRGQKLQIPLGPMAQKILAPFLKRLANSYLFTPAESIAWHRSKRKRRAVSKKKPVTRAKRIREVAPRYNSRTYRRAILHGCDRAGVPHWHPHQLRHARGTRIRRRYGLEAAQATLGHASMEATQIYAERNFSLAARIAKEIG